MVQTAWVSLECFLRVEYKLKGGTETAMSITDGIWNISTTPGRIEIKGTYPETPEVTGTVTREGTVIDIDRVTDIRIYGYEGDIEPWYRSEVSARLFETGEASEVAEIRYAINGRAEITYSEKFDLPLETEYTVSWYGILPD